MIDGLHLLPTWLPRGKTRWPDRPVDPPLSAALEAFPPGMLRSGATPGEGGNQRVKTRRAHARTSPVAWRVAPFYVS